MSPQSHEASVLLQALVGRSLPQLCVGVGDLQLRFEGELCVTLESPISTDQRATVEPCSLDGLAYLLPLLNATVTAAGATEKGGLRLVFGPTTLYCDADEHYEAWNYNGPGRALVVAMPGGDLAIWTGGGLSG